LHSEPGASASDTEAPALSNAQPLNGAHAHASPGVADAEIQDEFAEWDSMETIDAVADALAEYGDVIRLEANDEFPENVRESRPDIVFNIAEGRRGPNREAHVPAILEYLAIPYSGSDPFTLALCLDKARTKEILSYHGIPTASFARITTLDQLEPFRRRAFPVFVKPVHEGSSKGITERNICYDFDQLQLQSAHLLERYRQPVLAETFLPGEEFTCALIGNGDDVTMLPIVGMKFEGLPEGAAPIFGYEAKWIWDTREHPLPTYECPARISEGLRESLESVALRTYSALGCRDWSRIDLRLDAKGEPYVVEVNPLPGIAPNPDDHSFFPMAARAAGISYAELLQRVLLLAGARQGVKFPGTRTPARLRRRTPPYAVRAPEGR
jgi:D-alanine-D-alanine ligase